MYQKFEIDKLEYGLGISQSGNVWLDLLGGATKKGLAYRSPCKDLFWDEPWFDDVDLGVNTFKVFRVAADILLQHIFSKRPWRIGFSASTERKVKVYRWMVARLLGRIPNYNLVEYPEGVFNFYRLTGTPEWFAEEACHAAC